MDPKNLNIDETIEQYVVPWVTWAQQYAPVVFVSFLLIVILLWMQHRAKIRRKQQQQADYERGGIWNH